MCGNALQGKEICVVLEHDQKHRTNSVIRIYDGFIQAIILTFENNLERDNKYQLELAGKQKKHTELNPGGHDITSFQPLTFLTFPRTTFVRSMAPAPVAV